MPAICALSKPSDVEKGQWFFQRYIEHLPTAGEMVFFDRSWYNRAGVERVMGFCTPRRISGIHATGARILSGCWSARASGFTNTGSRSPREEQRRRFKARETDPLKMWKLSPIDKASPGQMG